MFPRQHPVLRKRYFLPANLPFWQPTPSRGYRPGCPRPVDSPKIRLRELVARQELGGATETKVVSGTQRPCPCLGTKFCLYGDFPMVRKSCLIRLPASLYAAKSYFAERISNAHSFVLRSFISTFTGGRKGVEYLQSILADLLRIT